MKNIKKIYDNNINILFKNKRYISIYILSLLFLILSFFNENNYVNPKAEILLVFLVLILGIIAIIYSIKHTKEIHKVALVIILLFGIIAIFINPILIDFNENEHITRSDMISSGELIPIYHEGKGYLSSSLYSQLNNNRGQTVLDNSLYKEPINHTKMFYPPSFSQNPFYGYILSGFGIILAKLLDLSVIWAMWLGRICNLLLYALICALAIKKAPVHKMTLLVISCLPLSIYQAGSFSVNGFMYCFAILSLGYFLFMFKTNLKIHIKDISIFFLSVLLISLFKAPYCLFAFLIFLIPREKFSSKKAFIISRILPLGIMIIGISYTIIYNYFNLGNIVNKEYILQNNMHFHDQIAYILNNPMNTTTFLLNSANLVPKMVIDLFRFSHMEWTYDSSILSIMYFVFFLMFSLTYPNEVNFKINNRIKILILASLIYINIIFIQYLNLTPIGYNKLDMFLGVYARDYIPILGFLPLIISLPETHKISNIDFKVVLIVIIFLSGTLILTISTFY